MNEEDLTGKTIQGYFVQKPIGLFHYRLAYIIFFKKVKESLLQFTKPKLKINV